MFTLVTIVHIVVSLGLILVVLLQTGKGAEMGAVFGGSSSTVFGSSGAGNFLTRLTTAMAIVFMMTSLTIGYFSGKRPSSSVFDTRTLETQVAPGETNAPARAPSEPAEAASGTTNPSEPPAPPAPGE